MSSYHGFMKFLYNECVCDQHGLLVESCESGECGKWRKNWNDFEVFAKETPANDTTTTPLQIMPPEEDTISIQRFEYQQTNKYGKKLAELNTPVNMEELLQYISSKLSDFIVHSSQRSRDYLFWKTWQNVITPPLTLMYMDFSENLSLPIQKEPQSLYWIRKQISILGEIIKYRDGSGEEIKFYSGHLSDDRDHDQVYVRKSLDQVIEKHPINTALVIRSDNANHFKSAENFRDLQEISDQLGKMVIRVFGTASHGKGEIDSCGGHLKNPVRQAIANKVHIASDIEAADYLNAHYADKTCPFYDVSTLDTDGLQGERMKRLYIQYNTVKGTDSFHVLVFKPGSNTFLAANQICVCANCLDMAFEDCDSFQQYEPLVGQMSEKMTRSKTNVADDEPVTTISGMVTKNSIFAIRAENTVTNYFLLICEEEENEHDDPEKPFVDDCGNVIHYGTKYLRGKYLECRNFNNKYHEFSKPTRAKTIAVDGDTVFFPQVPTTFISKCNTYYRVSNDIIHELQVRSSLVTE